MYIVERSCKNGNNVIYNPKSKVGPCYDWHIDASVDEKGRFFEHVKAFMIGSDALMSDD